MISSVFRQILPSAIRSSPGILLFVSGCAWHPLHTQLPFNIFGSYQMGNTSSSGNNIDFSSQTRKLSHNVVVTSEGKSAFQQWSWGSRVHSMLMIPWGILKKLQQADFTIQVIQSLSKIWFLHSLNHLSNPVRTCKLVAPRFWTVLLCSHPSQSS